MPAAFRALTSLLPPRTLRQSVCSACFKPPHQSCTAVVGVPCRATGLSGCTLFFILFLSCGCVWSTGATPPRTGPAEAVDTGHKRPLTCVSELGVDVEDGPRVHGSEEDGAVA